MAVAAAPGLGFAIPAAFGLAAAPMPVWIATAGLLAIKGLVGMRLLDVADSRAPRGRRIAAVALLAYLPTYAFALAGELAGFAHLDLTAMVPMIADQLLLAAVNLGILSMLAEQGARAARRGAHRSADRQLEPRLAGCQPRPADRGGDRTHPPRLRSF